MTDPINKLGDWRTRQAEMDEALGRYEYHAAKATKYLLEAFALDTPTVDRLHPQLRKVNVPTRKPNPDLNPGFSTMEDELSRQPLFRSPAPPQIAADDPRRSMQEPTYVSPYPRAALDKAAGRRPATDASPQAWKEIK